MKKYSYLFMNLSMAVLLPAMAILYDHFFEHEVVNGELIGKWFIFWAIGIRLFTAGVSQASNPRFTAGIFKMKSQESYVLIRELGFANISLGAMGILSVIHHDWRILAAITGGLFLGLAGIQHLFKKPDSQKEVIAMIYDLFVLLVIIIYVLRITLND